MSSPVARRFRDTLQTGLVGLAACSLNASRPVLQIRGASPAPPNATEIRGGDADVTWIDVTGRLGIGGMLGFSGRCSTFQSGRTSRPMPMNKLPSAHPT